MGCFKVNETLELEIKMHKGKYLHAECIPESW